MLKLRLLSGPHAGRQLRVHDAKPVSIGRLSGRLRLHDSRVSKHHAEIVFQKSAWLLRDLGSSNGTFVNHDRVESLTKLNSGDLLQIGRVLIKVLHADDYGMDSSTKSKPPTSLGEIDELLAGDIDSEQFGLEEIPRVTDSAPLLGGDFDVEAMLSELDEGLGKQAVAHLHTSAGNLPDDAGVSPGDLDEDASADIANLSSSRDAIDDFDISNGIDPALDDAVELEDVQIDSGDPMLAAADALIRYDKDSEDDLISLEADQEPSDTPARSVKSGKEDTTILPGMEQTTQKDSADDSGLSGELDQAEAEDNDLLESEAPKLVGLRLDQAPPQQPAPQDEVADADLDADQIDLSAADPAQASSGEFDRLSTGEFSFIEEAEPHFPTVEDVLAEPDEADIEEYVEKPKRTDKSAPMPEPAFDIDAAFEALSEGLDDSFHLPAISEVVSEEEETPSAPTPEDSTDIQPEPEPTLPAGSQLDVGFIKEALAKLDRGETQSPPADKPDSPPGDVRATARPATRGSSIPADAITVNSPSLERVGTQMPGTKPMSYSPPPGLNPTSMIPAAKPLGTQSTHGVRSKTWYLSGIALLLVACVGGYFVYSYFGPNPVTGRSRTSETTLNPNLPTAPAIPGAIAKPIPSENAPSTSKTGTQALPQPISPFSTRTTDEPGQSLTSQGDQNKPDPFSVGPAVIGGDALNGSSGPDKPQANPHDVDFVANPSIAPQITADTPSTDTSPTITRPAPPALLEPEPIALDSTPAQAAETTPGRIVFLVDTSGSLVDSLPQMLAWLRKAVLTVGEDEQFAIIFFKAGKAIEPDTPGMNTPSRELLAQLRTGWLNPEAIPLLPTGRSDPSAALKQAMSYKPTDIYLLSDESFARSAGDTTRDQAIAAVTHVIDDSGIKVHGVQFFYRDDASVLEALANRYGGTFEFVGERVIGDTNDIDLLKKLGGLE